MQLTRSTSSKGEARGAKLFLPNFLDLFSRICHSEPIIEESLPDIQFVQLSCVQCRYVTIVIWPMAPQISNCVSGWQSPVCCAETCGYSKVNRCACKQKKPISYLVPRDLFSYQLSEPIMTRHGNLLWHWPRHTHSISEYMYILKNEAACFGSLRKLLLRKTKSVGFDYSLPFCRLW